MINRIGRQRLSLSLHVLLYPAEKGRDITSPWKAHWNLIFIICLKCVPELSRSTVGGFGPVSLILGLIETCSEGGRTFFWGAQGGLPRGRTFRTFVH